MDPSKSKRPGGRVPLHGRPLPKPPINRAATVRAEVLSIGRELLRGRLPDGNAPMITEQLTRRGAVVHRITIVDDSTRAIATALTEAVERGSHVVVTTGGLGPGADDRTVDAIGEATSRPVTDSPEARRLVEAAYRRLHAGGLVAVGGLNAAREKMCSIPIGSQPIPNLIGVAPGILLRLPGSAALVVLPGVPEEARAVLEQALVLVADLFTPGVTAQREVETPTKDESTLQPVLDCVSEEFPEVFVKAHTPGFKRDKSGIVVTLETTADTLGDAEAAVEGALRRLLALACGQR
jgi:molybdenum cofactor synthesis domain-containing protein